MNAMNEMKETIFELLSASNVPRTAAELAAQLSMPVEEIQPLLDQLHAEARVAVSRKGKYALPEKIGMLAGRAAFLHNGSPVFRPLDGGDQLRIEEGRLRPMPDDLLLVRKLNEKSCTIEFICSRGRRELPAFVRIERSRGRRGMESLRASAVPCDRRIPYAIVLDGDLSFVRNNEIALIEIDEYPRDHRPIHGHAERVLGNADSMLARMRAAAEDHGFPTVFPEAVEDAARALCREELPPPSASRQDLRSLLLFTIDGVNSKDFDDAVSIEKMADGWRLGVHIADVSHYVREGSKVDQEALRRGTSLYLPGCTVPMLPESLSNDICSLMPDVDRLSMSLQMEISSQGKVVDFQLSRAIIRSKARLNYEAVNRFFETGESIAQAEVLQALEQMHALSAVLRKRRSERGSIDFDLPEAEFVLNEKYEPTDILCPPRGEAERMIEDFMLLANETVARLARDTAQPFIYRIHEQPDNDRIHQVEGFLSAAGTPMHLGDHPHSGMLQRVLDTYADDPRLEIVRRNLLRALKRAQYSEKPLGHYALSMQDYCHFTSPIRRYPDLMVHRMLKLLLDGDAAGSEKWEGRMPALAADCSMREFESVKAERDADDVMKARYMSHQLGRKFTGVISGVTSWGVYVTLENTVEGLVHVSDMDDYFNFDADHQMLVGSESGCILKLGMQVRVRVLSASVERGEINFELTRLPSAGA